MGFKRYKCYLGGEQYGEGTLTIISIPTFEDDNLGSHAGETAATANERYPEYFNNTYTWITANGTLWEILISDSAFTSTYCTSQQIVFGQSKLWFSQTAYVEFNQSSYSFRHNGSLLFTQTLSATNNTFLSLPSYGFNKSVNITQYNTTLQTFRLSLSGSVSSQAAIQAFYDSGEIAPDGDHPYENGGYNDPENPIGGDGPFTDETGVVDPAHIPSLSAVATGFCSLYNPTLGQTKALATYMWNNTDDFVNTLTKLVSDPLSTILGLHIVPIQPSSGSEEYIQLGNVSTNIRARKLTLTNFQVFNCGSVNITKYFNAYLDFAPYTKIMLYLPFIGYVNLDTDQIMDKSINVRYLIDFLTGACTAVVSVGGNDLYQYSGNCSYSIPITGSDLKSTISSIMSITGTIAAVGYSAYSGGGMTPNTAISAISNTINDAISMKPNIEHSGSLGGANGFLGVRHPYLIITRPTQCIPANLDKYEGYPLYAYKNFGSLSGYTVVDSPQLNNISATTEELNEILSLLRSGVIF
jgi:hypothetical protein